MYSISGFGTMIADGVRMDAYVRALRQAVTSDSAVLDIGTGTGIFALLARQFGARKVYAVEPDHAIEVAREIAAANGCLDRIEFIQDLSTRITLPERVDVIISDVRGVLPLFQHHIPTIVDARRRLLAPGGTLIPRRDVVLAAVVQAPDLYRRRMSPWEDRPYGLDMQAARRIVSNTWTRQRITPDQLLLEPRPWASLDYAGVESPDASGELTWTATRAGTGHGLNVWFDTVLADGVCFSNAPTGPELIYGGAFFPWSTPVSIASGDTVTVTLQANLVGQDYIWRWDTVVLDGGHPDRVKADLKQSTFFGAPLSPSQLRKQAAGYAPALNEDGELDQFILASMDGRSSLGEIARRVAEQYPGRFAGSQRALDRVGELAQRYGR